MTSFKEVRIAALAALQKSAWDADGYPIYCVMQDRHEDVHVGVYCNALSHIEVLSEHLDNATWCDGIKMHNARGESEDAERLFRYYTTVFLIMEECRQDLMDIGKTVSLRRPGALDGLATFTNKMLKHRRSQRGGFVAGFHVSNHHGPYFFADDPQHETTLPPSYTSIDNQDALESGQMSALLIPSMVEAARALGHAVAVAAAETANPAAIMHIEAEYSPRLPASGS